MAEGAQPTVTLKYLAAGLAAEQEMAVLSSAAFHLEYPPDGPSTWKPGAASGVVRPGNLRALPRV